MDVPLVELTRGRIVESLHFGAIAVTDSSGKRLAAAGDPGLVTFLRSSAKPFQALPTLESGALEALGLSDQEVAIMCASHLGSDAHVQAVSALLEKAGARETDLLCGTHPVGDPQVAERLLLRKEPATPLRHNCSGKHAGMLAYSRFRWGKTTSPSGQSYVDPQNPLQREIRKTLAQMGGLTEEQVELGIDGCSAPNFAVPLEAAAFSMARLIDPHELPPRRAEACGWITRAMTTYPELIRGAGSFDTEFMRAGGGRWVAKSGAEGYLLIGVRAGSAGYEHGIGIAIKISDGDRADRRSALGEGEPRARPIVALETMRQLGLISAAEGEALSTFGPRPIRNWRDLAVGEIRPAFRLG
ncbi:MAG: asparaginase [Anaerolineales bacterium]|jgi:L-asparaginase II